MEALLMELILECVKAGVAEAMTHKNKSEDELKALIESKRSEKDLLMEELGLK